MNINAREHRYVKIGVMSDALAWGWLPLPTLDGTHHGLWSVHCVWICDCPPMWSKTFNHPEMT